MRRVTDESSDIEASRETPRDEPPAKGEAGAITARRRPNWIEIRRVYEMTNTPTAEILRRYGLTESQLRYRREAEGWSARLPAAGKRMRSHSPEQLKARLMALQAALIARLEEWIAGSEHFIEDQARALLTLAAGWEHITRPDRTEDTMRRRETTTRGSASAREKKNDDARLDPRDDPAWLRAELKKRILRIRAADGSGGPSGHGAA